MFLQPFVFNSTAIVEAATAPGSEIRRLIDDAILTQTKSRVLLWVSEGPGVYSSKAISAANPAQIQGKQVRSFAPTISAVIQECGGQPVEIPAAELAVALESRKVDFAVSSLETVVGRKLWRFADTLTRTNQSTSQFVVVVNENFWSRLPPDYASIITAAADATNQEALEKAREFEATWLKDLTENHGMTAVDLTTEELQLWRICSSDILTRFMERSGELGQKLMSAYGRLRQQTCCNQPDLPLPAYNSSR